MVTLDDKTQERVESEGLHLTTILTDAAFFVEKLKEELKGKLMTPGERFDALPFYRQRILEEHAKLSDCDLKATPDIILALAYQDGLMHAFGDIKGTRNTGRFSDLHHIMHLAQSYAILFKEKEKMRDYWNASYIEGFRNGLFLNCSRRCKGGVALLLPLQEPWFQEHRDFPENRGIGRRKSSCSDLRKATRL